MKPKGKLIIIGGAEDKSHESIPDIAADERDFKRYDILDEMKPGKGSAAIELISVGSDLPGESRKNYTKVFKKMGYQTVGVINIAQRTELDDAGYIERIEKAKAVFFCGGDQFQLSTIIGGTPLLRLVREKFERDPAFVVAGTSAGAMAIPEVMIKEGGTEEVLLDTDIRTTSGFGLLSNAIVDTHFVKRGRFGRLAHAIMINPGHLGIGLGEDAAIIVRNGVDATCCGSGMIMLIDGRDIRQTNISDASRGCPVYVENLKVHILVKGCRFSLDGGVLVNPVMKKR